MSKRDTVPVSGGASVAPLPSYPAYRPSGVEWLGDVPEHWLIPELCYRYEVQLGKMLDSSRITGKHLAPYLRNIDVQWDRINTSDLPQMDFDDFDRRKFALHPGDLLVCEGGEVGRAAIWAGELSECYYQKALHRLRPLNGDIPRYLIYLLRYMAKSGIFTAGGNHNTIDHLPVDQLRKYRIPLPPLPEQRAIAAYLDRETGEMDALTAKKERLITLLEEKRAALISHTVTRGLDPDAPTRPSGIEWLGDVPEHWQVKRLKHISPFLTVGVVVNPTTYESETGVPFLLGNNVKEYSISLEKVKRLPPEVSDGELRKTRLSAGDIVCVRVGYPGVAAVVPPEAEGGNCASMMLVRGSKTFNSNWLAYVMNSRIGRYQVEVVQYGAAQKQFNISHAVDFWYPFPSLSEQNAIATYLDRKSSHIDTLISKIRGHIKLLQERRGALIAAAVTGKMDVRGAAPGGGRE